MNTCLIIEDEPLAAERLIAYIDRMPELSLTKWIDNGEGAVAFLKENKVDIIFLDLHLGESSGIHLLEEKAIVGKVIITTAYHQYALKGYELDVVDYLMKPFVFDRFEKAVRKALRKNNDRSQHIMIKSEYKLEKIFIDDILYIEGMGDYRRLHTTRGRIMTLQTFKEFEVLLEGTTVKRIHKSYMVNTDQILSYSSDELILKGDIHLPISDSYRKTIMKKD